MTFLMMAGGTGGHIFPALAVAKVLQAQGHSVHWLGAVGGMEERLVVDNDIALSTIQIGGLRGKGKLTLLLAPFKLVRALYQAICILLKLKPDCIVGMGGYVTGPGGLAARLCGIPLVIHEQNAIAGTTNRILAKMAQRVMAAFPGAFASNVKAIVTGNPVRKEIVDVRGDKRLVSDEEKRNLKLLIVGGSLGAQAINQIVPRVLARFPSDQCPTVRHQTGKTTFEETKQLYGACEVEGVVSPFIEDMAEAYSWADIVICRAGALTVSELCAVGVGAILIPLPHAIDDHQTKNALYMVNAGAGILLKQADMTEEHLYHLLSELLNAPSQVGEMATQAYQLGNPKATDQVVEICINAAKNGKRYD